MHVLSLGRHSIPIGFLLSALLSLHCSNGDEDDNGGSGKSGSGGSGGSGGSSKGGTGGGGRPPDVGGGIGTDPGGENCGLGDNAAFCETFDAPADTHGRAGELDSSKWSAARNQPQAPTGNGRVIGIIQATLPSCRSGLPGRVFPDQDSVICDENDLIGSSHFLAASASQNYGQNSYRIKQPFDFAGRTGKIVLDGEGFMRGILLGWISVEVTEDPTPGPSFALAQNFEGSTLPRNGFQVQFTDQCEGQAQFSQVTMSSLLVFDDYVQSEVPGDRGCKPTQAGSLNHFEIAVSQGRVEVLATAYSPDGLGFEAPQVIYGADVNLPFSRAYVSITVHNHATLKYSENGALDSWVARFDNVGFDGPVVDDVREYEVPDALVAGTNSTDGVAVMNVGYLARDVAEGPADTLHIPGVDLEGIQSARLAFSAWFLSLGMPAGYKLRFRFNGNEWRERALTATEAGLLNSGMAQGEVALMLDVPLSDLVAGDNTLEFVSEGVPQSIPTAVWNIDLVLSK